ncbi:XRE family transcriptional regulator [Sinirhodobacter populi]|uniref:XRE family transcriptional regulator n=1 Tax=Paenirhodobacter populi TaxID=2306993 RepID=A0A443KPY4_9RHOB|nr:XRE family transcriptional regulator [Sinirhodobacter populi]
MDEKWFKDRKRRASVTNAEIAAKLGRDHTVISKIVSGSQRMTMDWARIFAEMLQVPLSEVLEKTGMTDPQTAQQASPGFAESDAGPWAGRPAEHQKTTTIAEAFGAGPGIDVWQIRTSSMCLAGYLPGDFMLVDTHQAERVKAGDVVVAQVYSPRGAKTVLRRWMPPVLIAHAAPTEEEPVYVVDNDNVAIRGKVIASWRV